ncbi:hypothetical protein DPMN_103664 [Dreissena polymorpha]|uniref:Uncharacterized protein n=1 Tax=Dreissena polymorpha TaxID=45954 RepID=A0A9D4JZD7_DREPO|nr:hypothetical protein DPMN_103664 [Dreissena polymorpha]
MGSQDVTCRRPEHQNSLPSMFSTIRTAVLGHFHYLHCATPLKSWPASLPNVRPVRHLRCHLRYSRPSTGDVVITLTDNYHSAWRSFQFLGASKVSGRGRPA